MDGEKMERIENALGVLSQIVTNLEDAHQSIKHARGWLAQAKRPRTELLERFDECLDLITLLEDLMKNESAE